MVVRRRSEARVRSWSERASIRKVKRDGRPRKKAFFRFTLLSSRAGEGGRPPCSSPPWPPWSSPCWPFWHVRDEERERERREEQSRRARSIRFQPLLPHPFSIRPHFTPPALSLSSVWVLALTLAGIDVLSPLLAALRGTASAASAETAAAATARREAAAAEITRLRAVAGRVAADGRGEREEGTQEEAAATTPGARRRRT